ncbi:TetR/AcrR family transcriptional regulator [Gandjariella thermophila]|uniref:TetR family transcriptional regulator n=1 Tax=Gandjariella thermophila TaxID=1931992 RepID=A0A4D4JA98_9PSEU|nr:TetR/AcrR family transcriptional regulator [Gandjariella thermophila]GDY32242.1 TetR family transcriptional regulator [Gandjariella thermophila]
MPYRRTAGVQARLDASRERILSAALAIVGEQGYAACTVAAVAARAEVATGTVYTHFPGKATLVAEVFRRAANHEVDLVARAAATPGSARQRLTAMITTFAGRALRAPRLAFALLAEPADPAVDAERLALNRAYREIIARVLADGVRAGELPEQDLQVTAAGLVGAIGGALVVPLADGRADDATLPSIVNFLLRAAGVTDHHASLSGKER